MDWPDNKKFSQKHPPDKNTNRKPKPKYVAKDELQQSQSQNQVKQVEVSKHETKHEAKYETKYETKYEPKQYTKKKPAPRPRKEYEEKPELMAHKSSEAEMSCLICSEGIRKRDPIWTCQNCCISLHLRCIKQWIRKTNQDSEEKRKMIFNWQCIQCKNDFNEPMPEYFCFCGKQKNPELERDLEPHSCGEPCEKKRGLYCPHPCPDRCHSGKCRTCEFEGAKIKCHCGKTERATKCSEDKPVFQCGKKCEKLLGCGKHKCEKNCHQGPCIPCKKKQLADCYCGKNNDAVDCGEKSYGCNEPCGKTLDCEYHQCEDKCHHGPCRSCKKKPELQNTCCCGRYQLFMISEAVRESCKDPIPSCGMPCKKKIECGHECPQTCHEGRCPDCKVLIQQNCRCGTAQRKIECWKASSNKYSFECEAVCKKKRSCGIHTCNTVCCPFKNSPIPTDHTCEMTCQKMLNCERHTCDMPCHAGLCKKCPVIYSQPQPCPCGATSLRPPVICGTLTPECDNLCLKQMQCGHKCQQLCHYGICRCVEQVKVQCRCGKQMINTVCGRSALCMRKCQQTLDCGHKCLLQCHTGACQKVGSNGCKKKCDKIRRDCGHQCRQICHPDKKCEHFPCQAEILIKCECGHRQKSMLCGCLGGQKAIRKQIKCNSKCENLKRFDILYKGKEIYYANQLVQFGFKNFNYLLKIEERLEKFILQSDQNFIEVDFKFIGDIHSKNAMMNLFENHYHLNAHFYRHMKSASFTLMQGEDTMIPKPCLSEYVKQIGKGYIKRTSLPFEYTIKFDGESKERYDLILNTLKKNFHHKYYIERKERMIHAHFWDKEEALRAKHVLEIQHESTDFYGEENYSKEEEEQYIEEEEIIEKEVVEKEKKQKEPSQVQRQEKAEEGNKEEERIPKNEEERISNNEEEKGKFFKAEEKKDEKPMSKIITVQKKKPKIIVKQAPLFIRSEFPPASESVQQMYQIDEDELFTEKVDWDKLIENLRSKKMGVEASEWRIRSLVMISAFHPVKEQIFNEEFSRIFGMYKKEQQKAARILTIQKIDLKNIQAEMKENQIYLSDHEPEIVSYFLLHNSFSVDKLEYIPTETCSATHEVQRALEFIECVDELKLQEFHQQFKTADYVLSCCLIPYVHELRRRFLDGVVKKKIPVKDSAKFLLFDSDEQLVDFCKKNGIGMEKKLSKTKKEEVWKHLEGEVNKEYVQDVRFVKEIEKKRDKKYFLTEPEELINDCWMTRSFFAFGDFKESVNSKYMMALGRYLRDGE